MVLQDINDWNPNNNEWPIRVPSIDIASRVNDTLTDAYRILHQPMDINKLNVEEFNNMFLLFTALFSYYLNSEEVWEATFSKEVLPFVLSYFETWVIQQWWEKYIRYIQKHLKVYHHSLDTWSTIKGQINPQQFLDLILWIWQNMYGYDDFRSLPVVHWESEWLRNKWKYRSWKWLKLSTQGDRFKYSNFLFPPASEIPGLIESFTQLFNESEWDLLKQASLIYAFVFLMHPFNDWNSRTARILTITFLESRWFSRFRVFTFLTEVQKWFLWYRGLLQKYAYNWYATNRLRIEIDNDWNNIQRYPPMSEYIDIVKKFSWGVYQELNHVYEFVENNLEKILIVFSSLKILLRYHFEEFYQEEQKWLYHNENELRGYFEWTKERVIEIIFEMLTKKEIDFTKSIFDQVARAFTISKGHIRRLWIKRHEMSQEKFDEAEAFVNKINIMLYKKYIQGNLPFWEINTSIKITG